MNNKMISKLVLAGMLISSLAVVKAVGEEEISSDVIVNEQPVLVSAQSHKLRNVLIATGAVAGLIAGGYVADHCFNNGAVKTAVVNAVKKAATTTGSFVADKSKVAGFSIVKAACTTGSFVADKSKVAGSSIVKAACATGSFVADKTSSAYGFAKNLNYGRLAFWRKAVVIAPVVSVVAPVVVGVASETVAK